MPSTVSTDIFETLHDLLHRFRAGLRKSMESIHPELTFNALRVVAHVGRHPGVTQKELVEHSHTDKAQMARTLAQLEARGWLVRSADATDKRVRCLHLSSQGQQLHAQIGTLRQTLATELLQACPPAMQGELLALLRQALESAEQAE